MRLLIYSQDGMGLGHLRRTHNIARAVLARDPEANVLIVGDSPSLPFFAPQHGLDYLKLPTIVKTTHTHWQPGSLSLELDETLGLRSGLIAEAFRSFRPDAILVDHMPVGALGELKGLLLRARGEQRSPKLFLGLRDILDAPDAIKAAWTRHGAYEYLGAYDAVFIYGSRAIYDVEAAYQLMPSARRVTYCNYVAPRAEIGPLLDAPSEPFILAMAGGGADGFSVAETFLRALPLVRREWPGRALVLTGPNMPPADREALRLLAARNPATIQTSVPDAAAVLRRASAVVSMAGYNSLCEILQWRKKAVVIPRPGPSAEQRTRARLFSERELVRVVDPDELAPSRLAEELLRLLAGEQIPKPARIPPLDGAERAAELLLGALSLAEAHPRRGYA